MQCYMLGQVPIQGYSMFLCPSMGPLLVSSSVAITKDCQASRHHSPTALLMQHCACQPGLVHRSHTELGASICFPRGKGQTPIHSLLRHGWSYRIDEPSQPSRMSTEVACTEATNIKKPWEGSLMRCSCSMHR